VMLEFTVYEEAGAMRWRSEMDGVVIYRGKHSHFGAARALIDSSERATVSCILACSNWLSSLVQSNHTRCRFPMTVLTAFWARTGDAPRRILILTSAARCRDLRNYRRRSSKPP